MNALNKSNKIISLVDCNSFFCSCERLFRPDLRQKPVIVLSNNDGCVVSRTDEAKALGIPMGIPFFKIKNLVEVHQVAVFSSNYTLYGDLSRRVMSLLSEFTNDLEVYSIDEAFLDLTGMDLKGISEYCKKIKSLIYQQMGIPVSIGTAKTKVLAKMANKLAKNRKSEYLGVCVLIDDALIARELKTFPVEDIWGIGRKNSIKLKSYNIHTCDQLVKTDLTFIEKNFTIVGRKIVEELQGIYAFDLELSQKDKKQIISSRSFGKAVTSLNDLKEAVANHITGAAEKLRKQRGLTKSITVFIQTNPFQGVGQYFNSMTVTIAAGSSHTPKLIVLAFSALEKIYRSGFIYKKCGVIFNDIISKHSVQLNFLEEQDSLEQQKSMETLDLVNHFYGKNTVKPAACGTTTFWQMLSQMKSPCYTTRWSELKKIS